MGRGSFCQTEANTTLLSRNDAELQQVSPRFGECLTFPSTSLEVSPTNNEWPFWSSGGHVPWAPETENPRRGKPIVPCRQLPLFPSGENNKDAMVLRPPSPPKRDVGYRLKHPASLGISASRSECPVHPGRGGISRPIYTCISMLDESHTETSPASMVNRCRRQRF